MKFGKPEPAFTETAPASSVTPEDTTKEAEKEAGHVYDHGPLRTYEIVWADGKRETVQGHSVMFDHSFSFMPPGEPRFSIHGEFNGRWQFVIGGRADDVGTVRDITPPGQQAALTRALRTPDIETMEPGQVGYAVPWAMLADKKGRLWLKPEYPVKAAPGGTVKMRVERRKHDYVVTAPRGETWAPSYAWQKNLLPVAVVEEEKA